MLFSNKIIPLWFNYLILKILLNIFSFIKYNLESQKFNLADSCKENTWWKHKRTPFDSKERGFSALICTDLLQAKWTKNCTSNWIFNKIVLYHREKQADNKNLISVCDYFVGRAQFPLFVFCCFLGRPLQTWCSWRLKIPVASLTIKILQLENTTIQLLLPKTKNYINSLLNDCSNLHHIVYQPDRYFLHETFRAIFS